MNKREIATILAALRFWQSGVADNLHGGDQVNQIPEKFREHFEGASPLNMTEIDVLCSQINTGKYDEDAHSITATQMRHLKAVLKRACELDFTTTAEDLALREAIGVLTVKAK